MERFRCSKPLSFGEEVGNSVSHGVGALLMLGLLPFTAVYAAGRYGLAAAAAMSVFAASLFLMLLTSAVYHSMAHDSAQKYVLRILDHSMIYLAIAGSYVPVAVLLVGGLPGLLIILVQWACTVFGILYKVLARHVNERFSLALYLVMGWMAVLLIPAILQKTGWPFWAFLVGGGLAYTVGALFYARKKPYAHMAWHLFILLAAALHYTGIVFFML